MLLIAALSGLCYYIMEAMPTLHIEGAPSELGSDYRLRRAIAHKCSKPIDLKIN